ncbi:MAG: FAD-binding protein [Candidatus Taylorbacteria bacterium]|nr:FAD-binding protein [Candidatus Taylorbacteria bacterium]
MAKIKKVDTVQKARKSFGGKSLIIGTISALVLATLVFFGVRKVIEFGAAPKKDKDCDFIYPDVDETKPTNLSLGNDAVPFTFEQKGGMINDASCLNKTPVFGIAKITSTDDVAHALQYAKANGVKVTTAGQRHSMGGQSFMKGGLVLDMRDFNQMKLDKEHSSINVQTGATWASVQEYLDKQGFSVKAMQSINIFTVGGTLSVNAHGVAHDPGQVAPTVRSMHIMTADGKTVTASPTENKELFSHALGGYGLFGVILDVDLDVVTNEVYKWSTTYMNYKEFPAYFKQHVDGNKELGLMYARISLSPTGYLTETAVHEFARTDWNKPIPDLKPTSLDAFSRFVINLSKTGSFGRWFRWMLEKHVEHSLHSCVSRNAAMSPNEVCDVSRNQEMYDSMGYLKNRLPDTDILQEYFIPQDKMPEFIDGLRSTVKANKANLLNVTIRIVHEDKVTSLPYAKGDRFAFVLYFNQKFNDRESKILQKTTTDLIDLATSVGGTFYLPYQLYYSQEQLRKAYPEVDAFFAAKKKYDPSELFMNKWYDKYSK